MKNIDNNTVIRISDFIKKSGLKLLIILILAVVFLRKDFAFSINLRAPTNDSTPSEAQPFDEQPAPALDLNKKETKITEKNAASPLSETNKSSVLPSGQAASISSFAKLEAVDEKLKAAYIRRFAHVAVAEMKKYNIPASITLAQALLGSAAGTNALATKGNNHFGLKCGADWQAKRLVMADKVPYRQYEGAWNSFRDHSIFITSERFSRLKSIDRTNYKLWASELASANFSAADNYEQSLLDIIKKYELASYDF